MNEDLISREEAIKTVGHYYVRSGDKVQYAECALEKLPSAENDCEKCVAENDCEKCVFSPFKQFLPPKQKTGHWTQEKFNHAERGRIEYIRCSECDVCISISPIGMNYCPNCGADMRERSK